MARRRGNPEGIRVVCTQCGAHSRLVKRRDESLTDYECTCGGAFKRDSVSVPRMTWVRCAACDRMINGYSGKTIGEEAFLDTNERIQLCAVTICRSENQCGCPEIREVLEDLAPVPFALYELLEWRRAAIQNTFDIISEPFLDGFFATIMEGADEVEAER